MASAPSDLLRDAATGEIAEVLQRLNTSLTGLSEAEAAERLEVFGPNEVAQERRHEWLHRLWIAVRNPLVILLTVLAVLTFATAESSSDYAGGVVMLVMVVLGVSLRFVQETQRRQRGGQAQGDDQGHRHRRARRPAEGNSACSNSFPATW